MMERISLILLLKKQRVSDTNIVDVSDGTIIARGSGNAVISVSTKDGKFKADCTVAVEADKVEFTPLKGDAI